MEGGREAMDDSRYRHSWGCLNLARCLNLSRVVKEGVDQMPGSGEE